MYKVDKWEPSEVVFFDVGTPDDAGRSSSRHCSTAYCGRLLTIAETLSIAARHFFFVLSLLLIVHAFELFYSL